MLSFLLNNRTVARVGHFIPVWGFCREHHYNYWCVAILYAIVFWWLNWIDRQPRRNQYRTPPSVMMWRGWCVCMMTFGIFLICVESLHLAEPHKLLKAEWQSYLLMLLITLFAGGCSWSAYTLAGGATGYHRFMLKNGWHPFWDGLPRLFNPDSELLRRHGLPEPVYTTFVPPESWSSQCANCGAALPNDDDPCWNCGAADGTAVRLRFGQVFDEMAQEDAAVPPIVGSAQPRVAPLQPMQGPSNDQPPEQSGPYAPVDTD